MAIATVTANAAASAIAVRRAGGTVAASTSPAAIAAIAMTANAGWNAVVTTAISSTRTQPSRDGVTSASATLHASASASAIAGVSAVPVQNRSSSEAWVA